MLRALDLGHVFPGGAVGLAQVDLRVDRRGLCVIGPGGSGKSTLLRLLVGDLDPGVGRILWQGQDLSRDPLALRRLLAYAPQGLSLPRDLTLREYLEEGAALDGRRGRARREAAAAAAAQVHLEGVLGRRLGTFSGGMRRRAQLAQALLRPAEGLLVDEPSAGLDPREQLAMRQLLRELARSRLVVIATGRLEDAAFLQAPLLVLDRGEALAHTEPQHLVGLAEGRVYVAEAPPPGASGERWRPWVRPDGRMAWRGVGDPPPSGAVRVPPTLEDGYLLLLGLARDGTRPLLPEARVG